MHKNYDYTDVNLSEALGRPSKSQRKRQATALQVIGEKLVALNPLQLDKIPLPDELRDAILAAQHLTQHSARKRQLQYIGKLMRLIDPAPIQAALAALEARSAAARRQHHYLENLCAALAAGDEASLSDFLNRRPGADRRYLRQLMRNAAYEAANGKALKSRRTLFRYLRQQLEEAES